jgi:hypothetical protein
MRSSYTSDEELLIKTEELLIKTEELLIKSEELLIKTEELLIKSEELLIKREELLIKSEELLSTKLGSGEWRGVNLRMRGDEMKTFAALRLCVKSSLLFFMLARSENEK